MTKCEHMKVSGKRNSSNSQYHLSHHTVSKVNSYKYLGLHISDNLNWNTHINSVINKANRILYVTKLALGRSSRAVKETAYKAIVRPLLEYSSSVWDPCQAGQINAVEMVQWKAARFCLNRYQKIDSVSSMIQELNWSSLAEYRKASRLSSFCKVFNNEDSIIYTHLSLELLWKCFDMDITSESSL